jgi:diadenylate cyclase
MVTLPARQAALQWEPYARRIHGKRFLLAQLLSRLPTLSLLSLVDILVVAVLIYEFLVLIRGTRAAPMLVGVGVLALVFWAARVGELKTVDWIQRTLLPYAIFALIVVFQSEIRHLLAKLGRTITLSRGSHGFAREAYDDIVLAANLFSQNQTGALIVIEREIGLRTHIESGVPLDARLSYDLLATIFRPSAPLHDGAVIIQKDRIAAAACFLPLSMNPVLSTQLGTRHRAAIGITEETDAIAVVVSEETGAVSLAVAGNIERDLNAEELRQRLSELLRRYVPAAALPTPITNGTLDIADEGPGRGSARGAGYESEVDRER